MQHDPELLLLDEVLVPPVGKMKLPNSDGTPKKCGFIVGDVWKNRGWLRRMWWRVVRGLMWLWQRREGEVPNVSDVRRIRAFILVRVQMCRAKRHSHARAHR